MKPMRSGNLRRLFALMGMVVFLAHGRVSAQPFTVQGPGVNPADFRVATFASGLDFPLGVAQLPDQSLLVTLVQGTSFFSASSIGKLVRFNDVDGNGIADNAGTIL